MYVCVNCLSQVYGHTARTFIEYKSRYVYVVNVHRSWGGGLLYPEGNLGENVIPSLISSEKQLLLFKCTKLRL